MKKGGQRDFTVAESYRPISLLSTLGKGLEFLVAERLSYLVEHYNLLPERHFGGRKQRSATQALTYLQEKVYEAWKQRKVVSIVTFDNKGAFNGVNKAPELRRLRERGIPARLVSWIDDFCSERRASISVNSYNSPTTDLYQAGLPQGSPLSPILFLFSNANLVQEKITSGGSMAYIDDYTAWIIGATPQANTEAIQQRIVPLLETWERTSGATFDAAKTQLLHATRNSANNMEGESIVFKDMQVKPSATIKLLGVRFDSALRFQDHIATVSAKATRAAMQLKRLRSLRPLTTRRLFTAMITPITDYASPIWSHAVTKKLQRELDKSQRIGATAITGAFRNTRLADLEMEASIPSTRERLDKQKESFWISSYSLPQKHIMWATKKIKGQRFYSPGQQAREQLSYLKLQHMETIYPFCIPPWQQPTRTLILPRDQAKDFASTSPTAVFVDGSMKDGQCGLGVWSGGLNLSSSITTTSAAKGSAYSAELQAVRAALDLIPAVLAGVIFTDSQNVVKSLHKPRHQSGQSIIREIIEKASFRISFCWIPGHSSIEGNDRANSLAKEATTPQSQSTVRTLFKTAALREAARRRQINLQPPELGPALRAIDCSLPNKANTARIYNALSSRDARIIAQMRTGKHHLNSYKALITDTSPECECRQADETLQHFLFDCPLWEAHRDLLRSCRKYHDLSYHLGGSSAIDDKTWTADMAAIKTTAAFTKLTGRFNPAYTLLTRYSYHLSRLTTPPRCKDLFPSSPTNNDGYTSSTLSPVTRGLSGQFNSLRWFTIAVARSQLTQISLHIRKHKSGQIG